MRKMKLFCWFIAITFTIGFVSCGGDEEDPDPNRPDSEQKTSKITYSVVIGADSKFEQSKTLKLNEIVVDYPQYVTEGQLQMNTSNVKVIGLSNVAGARLTNFTLSVKNDANANINLGTLTRDTTFSTNNALTFMQKSTDHLVSNGSSEIVLTFTSASDINSTEGVKVELNYDATYKLR